MQTWHQSMFGCVSAGWSLEYNRFPISPAVTVLLGLLSWPAGSRQDAPRLASSPSRTWTKRIPLDCYFKKENLHKTPQSKQIGHACFSRSNDVTKTLPFPSRVNTQREAKRLCQLHRRAFSRRVCELKGDILISPLWTSGRYLCGVSPSVEIFESLGGQLTRAGEMKEEAEVKSLDRPSMLLLLFW